VLPSPPGNCSASVVIPVGRADDALEAQLDAVRAQGGVNLIEIILAVNDAAHGALVRVRELVARAADPRVRVVDASRRRGASFARNCGAAVATGDVLAFCDADDLVAVGWLAALVAGLVIFDAVGGRLDEIADDSGRHRPPPTPDALPTFLGVPYIVSANMGLPRSTFESVGGFDTELHRCEDIAFSWRLLVAGSSLGYIDDARVAYRPRSGSLAVARQHFAYGRGMAQVLYR
jgi:glycosyltransferase involved in cell wall biosynthesis